MVGKGRTRKAVNQFRGITFPGTENRLGKPPGTFMVDDGKTIGDISFPGTEGRLGTPPKLRKFDQRKKAKNRLNVFNLGDELL